MIKRLFTVRNLVILVVVVITPFVISSVLGLKVAPPEVALAAPPLFHIGSFAVTNALFTAWVVMIILIVIALLATRYHPKDLSSASNSELVPSGLANLVEWIIDGLHGLTRSVAGSWTPRFFPIVMTIFLFVITSNWLGLLPGVGSIGLLEHAPLHEAGVVPLVAAGHILTATRAPSAEEGYVLVSFLRPPSTDLNFTLALALAAVGLCQYFGVKASKLSYFKRFADFSGFKQGALMGVIMVFVGLLELIAEFARIISFAFRLFGNIFAGEILLMVIAFLIPYFASLPFYGLEVFVGFIQALVFMMLALVFMTVATIGHNAEGHR